MTNPSWMAVPLHGANEIAKVVSIYDIGDMRVPDTHYKIKVLQSAEHTFFASPNVCVRLPPGIPDWVGGRGKTEMEALENALKAIGKALDTLGGRVDQELFEWSDPTEF